MNLYDFKKQINIDQGKNYYTMEILTEIETRLNSLSNTTMIGNEFEEYAKQYFNYKMKINTYALHEIKDNDNNLFNIAKIIGVENISDIKDMGVDLIGKSEENIIYLIQVKYHTNKNIIISLSDVSTFLSMISIFEKTYPNLTFKFYIFSNVNSVNSLVLRSGCDFIGRKIILENNFVYDRYAQTRMKLNPNKKIELFDIQKEVINNILNSSEKKGLISMAPGSGKTLITYDLILNLEKIYVSNFKTLILVPSLYLLTQMLNNFNYYNDSYKPHNFKFCMLGSDFYYDKKYSKKFIGRQLKSNLRLMSENEMNYNDINQIFTNQDSNINIFLSTYHSALLFYDKLKEIQFSTIIIDEAHKIYDNEFSALSLLNSDRMYFMTATPRIQQLELFGKCFMEYSVIDAIEDNIISDFKLVNYLYNDANTKELTDNFISDKNVKLKNDHIVIIYKMIEELTETFQGRISKILTFHDTIEAADEFSKRAKDYFGEDCFSKFMYGEMSVKKRERIIKKFSKSTKKISIIASAKVLAEGVNIPCVDTVIFAKPRYSTIDIIQCLGRCLRKYPGKMNGYIIVPTAYNTRTTTNVSDSDFSTILAVLKSLNKTIVNDKIINKLTMIYQKYKSKLKTMRAIVVDNEELNKIKIQIIDRMLLGYDKTPTYTKYKRTVQNVYKLKTKEEYESFKKMEGSYFISDPESSFLNKWRGWDDLLGIKQNFTIEYLKVLVREKNIRTYTEYKLYADKNDLPLELEPLFNNISPGTFFTQINNSET